jgi:ketosteroid isomerase-like protein
MYKAAARALIRRNIRELNEGRYEPALAMFADDAQLTFPGQNSWSRQHRVPRGGRTPDPTHRGRDEIESFLRSYADLGIQMEVEDILVNGPPWNLRAAVRVHDWIPGPNGDVYANRAVLMVRVVWGKIRSQEDYEDTERTSALDLGYSVMPVPRGNEGAGAMTSDRRSITVPALASSQRVPNTTTAVLEQRQTTNRPCAS